MGTSYRGRPSKGCEPCRARKVKCDEAKPVCSRCNKSKYNCRYRDQADLLFRNQTAFAAQRAEESWRKRSKSHQRTLSESLASRKYPSCDKSSPSSRRHQRSISDSHNSHQSLLNNFEYDPTYHIFNGAASTLILDNLTMAPPVNPDLRRLAYERFIYDFVSPQSPNRLPEEPSDALWTFIPTLYQKAAEDSCIATVVNAVAYINFDNRCNAPQAKALAEDCLGKAFTLLSKAIADKKLAATNEALCSVYLMGVYEKLTTQQRNGAFNAHQDGANALLQLRSIEQYYSDPVAAKIYEVAYTQMLIFWQQLLGNLQAGKRPPPPMRDVVCAQQYLPKIYSNSNVFVINLIWREAMLHAKWHEVKQSDNPPTCRLDLQELLQTALDLDGEFQAWETTIPAAWRYQMEPNIPETRSTYDAKWQKLVLGSRGAPEEIHSYSNLKMCWIWGFYRTTRIFLLRDILEMLNWMFRLPEPDPLIFQMDMMHNGTAFPSASNDFDIIGLDNMALRVRHSFATVHMVNIIEKSCSAILGNFTVPMYSKSCEDVAGIRGYVCLWALGTMDAVLGSGLVPDLHAPNSPPSTVHDSPREPAFSRASEIPHNDPVSFDMSPQHIALAFNSVSAPATLWTGFPNLPPTPGIDPQQHCETPNIIQSTTPPLAFTFMKSKNHVFDSSPTHPFDCPVNLPTLDFNITKPKKIDIAATREWINSILYYIGTELGIKKALYVPLTEGFMPIVKPSVDSILSR
ncbi:hypothetical protein BKA66DRAFT_545309 [Pyrenochaeta sp. MPI-SDFR-AT-0127]|nr:hypothetical protein BKA66DRAFT_545309 [Pyrenochaeta sp. MPI-SDFR-AT-0127]